MIARTVPFLGLEWHISPGESADKSGECATVVRRVIPNSPAQRAGMQVGDVIHSVDGAALTSRSTLTDKIIHKKPGAVVVLEVTRNEKRVHVKVALGERQMPAYRHAPVAQSAPAGRD